MDTKEQKYDRQLRLWGDHGQYDLEKASVCLLNVTATGTEVLKNLILPGIGAFCIIDDTLVSAENLGNNFFLDYDSIGLSKAQVATSLLNELNPDVKGEFIEESPIKLLEKNSDFFLKFSLVVACDLKENDLIKISSFLWNHKIPLVLCISYGFIGYMRLVFEDVTIIESHPDNSHPDLRLTNPFPELLDHVKTIDLDLMSKKDHSHLPYVVILLKCLEKWKAEKKDLPKSYKEKKQFAQFVMTQRKKNDEGLYEDEENFIEASKQVNISLVNNPISSDVYDILNHPKCLTLDDSSEHFWILCQALKRFLNKNGTLPLNGSLPDMFSDSNSYIQLQNIYRRKAIKDLNEISEYVYQIYAELKKVDVEIPEVYLKRFCQNAHHLKYITSSSIQDEYTNIPSDQVLNCLKCDESENSDIIWYTVLRASQRFRQTFNRFPKVEADLVQFKACLNDLTVLWGVPGVVEAVLNNYCHEICRYASYELHSVASYLGGVASQEIIKLITRQYVPLSNAFIYNGITASCTTFKV